MRGGIESGIHRRVGPLFSSYDGVCQPRGSACQTAGSMVGTLTVNARISRMSKLRARRIKLILFDVDGVLTDGKIWIFPAPSGVQQSVLEQSGQHGGQGFGF